MRLGSTFLRLLVTRLHNRPPDVEAASAMRPHCGRSACLSVILKAAVRSVDVLGGKRAFEPLGCRACQTTLFVRTAALYVALIRAIFRRAVREWEWIDRVPAFKTYSRRGKVRVRWITEEQAERLLRELPEHQRDVVVLRSRRGFDRAMCWVSPGTGFSLPDGWPRSRMATPRTATL